MKQISMDCLFAVNFCVNYLCLRLCTTILQKDLKSLYRLSAGAVLIALFECLSCVLPKYLPTPVLAAVSFLVVFALYLRIDIALVYMCFSLWSGLLMTFAMKFFKGVLQMNEVTVNGVQFNQKKLLLASAVFLSLALLKFYFDRAQVHPKEATLEVIYKSRKLRLKAMRDSGNLLRDPLSGRPVAILSGDAAKKLGIGKNALLDFGMGLRVIPIKSVGHTGILYAFVPKMALVDGKKREICVALDPENTDFSGFDAIIPLNI